MSLSLSRLGFFNILKIIGNFSFLSDSLIMLVRNGSSLSTHCFTNHVGKGSTSHDLFGHEAITSWISSDVVDIRLLSLTNAKGSISSSLLASILKLVLNVSIVSSKNMLNRLANSKLIEWVGIVLLLFAGSP